MDRHDYEELELIGSRNAVLRSPSWPVETAEVIAAYRVDKRLRSLQTLATAAVDAIIELDDYVSVRAVGRHPAVVAGLHQLQDTTAACANLLISHYLMRNL